MVAFLPPSRAGRSTSTETVSQWVDRWLTWRTIRGLSSTPHDKGRLAGYVLPVLGPLPMHAVARGDVERVVERLDRLIALPEGHYDRISWKTAATRGCCVQDVQGHGGPSSVIYASATTIRPRVRPPEHGDRKAKVYLYPSEFLALVSCSTIDRPFRFCTRSRSTRSCARASWTRSNGKTSTSSMASFRSTRRLTARRARSSRRRAARRGAF